MAAYRTAIAEYGGVDIHHRLSHAEGAQIWRPGARLAMLRNISSADRTCFLHAYVASIRPPRSIPGVCGVTSRCGPHGALADSVGAS